MTFKSYKNFGSQMSIYRKILAARPSPPANAVFQYSFNDTLTKNETTGKDDGTNYGAILDNEVFVKGSGSSKFVGSDSVSYVSTPSFPISQDTGYSFGLWFKIPPDTLNGFDPIISNNNGNHPAIIIGQDYQNPNCMFIYSTNSTNSGLINIFYSTPIFTGDWHHIVITISADNSILKWYLDGIQISYSNRQENTDPSLYPQEKKFQMGTSRKFTGEYNIDNFYFFDRQLSGEEALQLYSS